MHQPKETAVPAFGLPAHGHAVGPDVLQVLDDLGEEAQLLTVEQRGDTGHGEEAEEAEIRAPPGEAREGGEARVIVGGEEPHRRRRGAAAEDLDFEEPAASFGGIDGTVREEIGDRRVEPEIRGRVEGTFGAPAVGVARDQLADHHPIGLDGREAGAHGAGEIDGHLSGRVEAEAVDTTAGPELGGAEDQLAHLRRGQVEQRRVRAGAVMDERGRITGPAKPARAGRGAAEGEDLLVGRESAAGMGEGEVDDEVHAAGVEIGDEPIEGLVAAEIRIDGERVDDIISMAGSRHVNGCQIQRVDAEALQIVERSAHTFEVPAGGATRAGIRAPG
ncbi:MAG: hypothetical protein QM820_25360 [Minicystis sp.]